MRILKCTHIQYFLDGKSGCFDFLTSLVNVYVQLGTSKFSSNSGRINNSKNILGKDFLKTKAVFSPGVIESDN